MSKTKQKHQNLNTLNSSHIESGFSLIECIFALLVLMIVALSVVSVFDYSYKSNFNARKRFAALLLAQQRVEDVRNTTFTNLPAGTVTENSVINDGIKYKIVRTITDNDLVNKDTAPGPETKQINITVSPVDSSLASDAVTLTTFRAVNRPGPNRQSNNP